MKKKYLKKDLKLFLKIIKASQYHDVDMEKLKSLDVKSFINVSDMNRRTPIHFALKNLDVLKFLIENGADVNAANIWYLTPLLVAKKILKKTLKGSEKIIQRQTDIVNLLIQHGAKEQA